MGFSKAYASSSHIHDPTIRNMDIIIAVKAWMHNKFTFDFIIDWKKWFFPFIKFKIKKNKKGKISLHLKLKK